MNVIINDQWWACPIPLKKLRQDLSIHNFLQKKIQIIQSNDYDCFKRKPKKKLLRNHIIRMSNKQNKKTKRMVRIIFSKVDNSRNEKIGKMASVAPPQNSKSRKWKWNRDMERHFFTIIIYFNKQTINFFVASIHLEM